MKKETKNKIIEEVIKDIADGEHKTHSKETQYIQNIYTLSILIDKLIDIFNLSYGGDVLITNSPFLNQSYTYLRRIYLQIIDSYKDTEYENRDTIKNKINDIPEFLSDFKEVEKDVWWNDFEKENEFIRLKEIIHREIVAYINSKDNELEKDYFETFSLFFNSTNPELEEGIDELKKVKLKKSKDLENYLDTKYPKNTEEDVRKNKENQVRLDNNVFFDKKTPAIITNDVKIKLMKDKNTYHIIKYLFERKNTYEECFYDEITNNIKELISDEAKNKSREELDKSVYDTLLQFNKRLENTRIKDLFKIRYRSISINEDYTIKHDI